MIFVQCVFEPSALNAGDVLLLDFHAAPRAMVRFLIGVGHPVVFAEFIQVVLRPPLVDPICLPS